MQSEYYGIKLTCKMSHGVAGQASRRSRPVRDRKFFVYGSIRDSGRLLFGESEVSRWP